MKLNTTIKSFYKEKWQASVHLLQSLTLAIDLNAEIQKTKRFSMVANIPGGSVTLWAPITQIFTDYTHF
jgi:hypothetical protein